KYGAGHNLRNVICVTLGTGIGGGLILNGRLYRGSTKVAGEIARPRSTIRARISFTAIKERWKLTSVTCTSPNEPRRFTRRPVRPSLTRKPTLHNSQPRRTNLLGK